MKRFVFAAALAGALAASCGKSEPQEGPAEVARKYLAAETWNQRLEHVLHPPSVAQVLTGRGIDLAASLEPQDTGQALEVSPAEWQRLEPGKLAVVRTGSRIVDPALKRGYRGVDEIYLFQTAAGFRVDDHATWGRNPVTIRELRDLGPDVTLKLRVMAKRDTRYPQVSDKERFSMNLAFPTDTWIGASALRASEAGRRLEGLLADGAYHKLVLEARTAGRPSWLTLTVTGVMQEGWAFWDPTGSFMGQLAGPSAAAVDVGQVRVEGQWPPERIRGIVLLHVEEIRDCYKQGLTVRPGLRGEVLVKAFVLMDGSVQIASVERTMPGDPGVGKCLADEVQSWTFNNPDNWKRSVVDIPFILGR